MPLSNRICAVVAGVVLMLGALPAHAVPIRYSFSVTATSGPLNGDTQNGAFTYNSSSIIAGDVNLNTGLLTALNFTWNGISYDQTTANTGWLYFDTDGTLLEAVFGNNCTAGECTVTVGTNQWSLEAVVTGSPMGEFVYATPQSSNTYPGTETISLVSAVPEPSALALLAIGIAALGFVNAPRRRRLD